MNPLASTRATARKERHPIGLYVLFSTELWERFSFYTMLSLLALYLNAAVSAGGMGWSLPDAQKTVATYLFLVYAGPVLGGWVADRFTGARLAVTIGGIIMAVGHLLMAFPTVPLLFCALACLVIGCAFFKPNVSTLIGDLYPDGSPLKDSAYNIFYMGINIGAFAAAIVAEIMSQRFGYHWAFAIAGFGMILSLVIFWGLQRHIQPIVCNAGHPALAGNIPEIAHAPSDLAMDRVPDRSRIIALLVIFAVVIIFWMANNMQFSTLIYWADKNTDWSLSPFLLQVLAWLTFGTVKVDLANVSGVASNAINPFWIMALTYPLVGFWGFLNKRGKEPSTPTKMVYGMLFTALAFAFMAYAGVLGGDTGKVSPWWLISGYGLLTLGELLLSPMGLSLVSKVAPVRMRSMMMGMWFFAIALGGELTVIGVYWDEWRHSTFFTLIALLSLATALLLMLLLRPLKKSMPGA